MKIAIDSGHGSNTAGKRTPSGYREHWFNTAVCVELAKILAERGFDIVRTGWNDENSKDDADTPLSTRQKIIKDAKCDISVSVHYNACGDGKSYNNAQGIETLIHTTYRNDSKALADKVQKHLVQGTKQTNRGVKVGSLSMVNCRRLGTKASILVECGFMTNKYEEELMMSQAFVDENAKEIADGVCEYLDVDYVSEIDSQSVTDPYSLVFNAEYYANRYADLKATFGYDENKLLEHFKKYGMAEGRQAIDTFSVHVYKAKYADLQKAFGIDLPKYYEHYMTYGYKEGRQGI